MVSNLRIADETALFAESQEEEGDSSVFVLSRTGHFGYSPVHNSVNINARNFILHIHRSCHICVSMCDHNFFVNYFNWLIYS